MPVPTNPTQGAVRDVESAVWERFEAETVDHRLRILHDDGPYRHLRFNKPGTLWYGYDLTTWPGHLAIAGDCGSYMFARISDMFTFFRGERINPDYWRGKLTNPGMMDGTRRFSADKFEPRVMEWYREQCEDEVDEDDRLLCAVREQLLARAPFDHREAIELLSEFEHDGPGGRVQIYEPCEWDFSEWDWPFLWCCWAIVQGIAQYDWTKGWL